MLKAIFIVGCPKIGKTTWAEASFNSDFYRLNSDDFNANFAEDLIAVAKSKRDMLIDGTNCLPFRREAMVNTLLQHGYTCTAYHFDFPLTWAMKIGSFLRTDADLRKRYMEAKRSLSAYPPKHDEGFDTVVKIDNIAFLPKIEQRSALFFQVEAIVSSPISFPHAIRIPFAVNSVLKDYYDRNFLLIGIGHVGNHLEIRYQDCLIEIIKAVNPPIKEILYCRHPNGEVKPESPCACRLPNPGLSYHAAKKYGIDLRSSIMIGRNKDDEVFAMRSAFSQYIDQEVAFQSSKILSGIKQCLEV